MYLCPILFLQKDFLKMQLIKKVIYVILVACISSCTGKEKSSHREINKEVAAEGITKFEINEEIHNFGTLDAGEVVVFSFVLKNTGQNNLIIKNIETDCGCITVNYKKDPIKPGKQGIVEVRFDTTGLFGRQYKPIELEMNTEDKTKDLAVVADIKNKQIKINY